MKVLIIGGYGTFGFGIAERLADEAGLELILAGRSLIKATAACSKLSGAATFTPLQLDRTALSLNFKPDIIIDASGPFQTYETQNVVEYCLAEKIAYADISDDGEFVKAVTSRQSVDVPLISGLSTCPVLSAIGLREVEKHIGPATNVKIGIAPSPKANLGRNVVAAVASYAGQITVPVLRENTVQRVAGLTEIYNETICVPGDTPLPRLPFAVADAADALVLKSSFTGLQNIWTGAGTRPVWLHRLLIILARGVSKGVFPKLSPFASIFHRTRGLFRIGSHRGGMFVRASNETGEASWHLVAEGDHGPLIPALPVVALIRKMLRGAGPKLGAYSGDQVINLDDLAPEFEHLDITYGLHLDGAHLAVYERILGDRYGSLSPAIQDLHRTGSGRIFTGQCTVTRGRNPLSHIVAAVIGFPKSGQNVPVSVEVKPDDKGETWTRTFGNQSFKSHHSLREGRWARHISEQFGPITIRMAILEEAGRMRIETKGWTIFGIPLPGFLKPGGDVYETQDDQGRFVFHVDLIAPLFGRLCKYEGWLVPDTQVD